MNSLPAAGGARVLPLLLVGVCGAALFLPWLGRRDLLLRSEARVAQAARQMRTGGDWLLPHLGEDLRLKKPPLAYWLAAAASLPFADVDEFNARLPNALAAIGCMLLVCLLGRRLFSPLAGLLGALFLGLTAAFWLQGRNCGIEMPLLLLNLAALAAWLVSRDPGRERWLLVCWALLGLSVLQKGPIGPLLVLLLALASRFVLGPAPSNRRRWHLAGIGLFLLVALPWPIAVWLRAPEAAAVWWREFGGRLEGFDHIQPWHAYLRIVPIEGLPWSLLALFALLHLRLAPPERRAGLRWLAAWAGLVLLLFSIPGSKRHSYILPIYPALALLAGEFTARAAEGKAGAALEATLRRVWSGIGLAFALCGAAHSCGLFSRIEALQDWTESDGWVRWLGVPFALGGIAILACARRGHWRGAALSAVASACVLIPWYRAVTDEVYQCASVKPACRALAPALKPETMLFACWMDEAVPVLMFYLDRHVEEVEPETAEALCAALANAGGSGVAALPSERAEALLATPAGTRLERLPASTKACAWLRLRPSGL